MECLRDRSIFIGGNSISRQLAHAMSVLLSPLNRAGNALPSLEYTSDFMKDETKTYCGKAAIGGEDRPTACRFHVGLNTSITYGMMQRVHSDMLFRALASMRPDVMVLHAGSDDIFHPPFRAAWPVVQEQLAQALARALGTLPVPVYWRTSTRVCNDSYGHSAQTLNAALQASNQLLLSELCRTRVAPSTQRVPPSPQTLRIADTFAWTWGRCADYNGNIHHPRLAYEHATAILTDLCSSGWGLAADRDSRHAAAGEPVASPSTISKPPERVGRQPASRGRVALPAAWLAMKQQCDPLRDKLISPRSSVVARERSNLTREEMGSVRATLVVASCESPLQWVVPLLRLGLDATVMEQCSRTRDDLPAEIKLRAVPRCGREAHSYIAYIISEWHALPNHLFFLQGDAPKHWPPAHHPAWAYKEMKILVESAASFAVLPESGGERAPAHAAGVRW